MTKQLTCPVSDSIWSALQQEIDRTGDSLSHVLERAVSDALGLDHHSLFQVSTSGALVQGVFQGCTRVQDLKGHGDFGLGTFDNLDGELVMLDGHCFQAGVDGVLREANDDWRVPFATITRFEADRAETIPAVESFSALEIALNRLRPSENIFTGIRLNGVFKKLDLRAACKALPGEGLVEATRHQSIFSFDNIAGTLVGFWSPDYAGALNVPGYHLHFLSADRTRGGHVLDLNAPVLEAALHFETDVHLAIPETTEFLQADLRGDPRAALNIAEKKPAEEE